VEPYGWMFCESCIKRQRELAKPKVSAEITTDAIKEDRKIFQKDIAQPFRQGVLAKEFVDANPEQVKKMVEEGHVTESEVKNAKPIWDLDYYKK
jgi:hypothetical protein